MYKGVLSDSICGIRSPARCCTRVLGPGSPSLRRRAACCVDGPSVGGSKIWGEMRRNMESAKECLSRGDVGRGGGKAARQQGAKGNRCKAVMWSK